MPSWHQVAAMLALALFYLYALDRVIKFVAVFVFFHSKSDYTPETAHSISLIQPVTRGASALRENLRARLNVRYPGRISHIIVCDLEDTESQEICRNAFEEATEADGKIVVVASEDGMTSKIAKMQAGVRMATGDILCFMDDDVAPRSDNLTRFVQELSRPGVGAAFGLACYSNWAERGSALMSGFVNGNALFAYIPLSFLTSPFTITGHFFALWRTVWDESGGLDGLNAERNDDDHEIARRVLKSGHRIAQSAAIYDVDNRLPSLGDYNRQMKRWSAFMRLWCWPNLSGRQQAASVFNIAGNLIPGIVLLLAITAPGRLTIMTFVALMAINIQAYVVCATNFLKQKVSLLHVTAVCAALLLTPFQMLLSPLWGNIIYWRGARYRVLPGGLLERAE